MTATPSPLRRLVDAFNRRFVKAHTRLYAASRGLVGHHMTFPVTSLLLHTTGRRSGQRRTVALAYGRDGSDYLIVASNFGGPRPPAWLANLRAEPRAEIRVGRRLLPVTADVRMPGSDDYDRLFAVADRASRGRYARYRTMTDRPIPIVRLVPDR